MNNLNKKLLLNFLLISALISFCIGFFYSNLKLTQLTESSKKEMKEVHRTHNEILSFNIWELNDVQIDKTLQAYYKNKSIDAVKLEFESLDGNQVKQIGQLPEETISVHFKLKHEGTEVGKITLVEDKTKLKAFLKSEIIDVAIIEFIKVLLTSFVLFLLIRRMVLRYIVKITDFIANADSDQKSNLTLGRNKNNDELTYLEESINSYRSKIFENEKDLEARITERTKELQKASKAKSLFLASMSHEIRTPLMAVTSCLDLINKNALDKKNLNLNLIEIANNGGEDLLRIVDDILDFSKLETNSVVLEKKSVEVNKLFNEIISLYTNSAKKKNINLSLDIIQGKYEYILADEVRVKQVVGNILSNAIKFTPSFGNVDVYVDFKNSEIEIQVKDSGVGIQPEKISLIFEYFQQEDISTTREFGGTGLGLAISKSIINLLGGEILVESEVGEGATFKIHFPIEIADREVVFKEEEHFDSTGLSELCILVAEDNDINQIIIKKILDKLSIKYFVVSNGEKAYQAIKDEPDRYDFVFMDLHMPILDGVEASKKIISSLVNPPPIIALTASVLDEDVQKCLNAGMVDFLSKPVKINTLKNCLQNNMRKILKAS